MIRSIIFLIVAGVVAVTSSCGGRAPSDRKPVAVVNGYVITADDFRQELALYQRFHNISALSVEDKQRILDERIRQELFIQQAVKLGLDKDPGFRQTIERYWEQTLISSLIKKQLAGDNATIVTEEEIDQACKKLPPQVQANPAALKAMREQLAKQIREEKKAKLLDDWSQKLWNKAKITVYKQNVTDLR
ncbi:MAG: SurA N-terminal domain-containing protein [Syntrophobacteraceae bacterium]|nr:SurA N-terminal domain-containing protein [Syntrophobacteraceae bacterium]